MLAISCNILPYGCADSGEGLRLLQLPHIEDLGAAGINTFQFLGSSSRLVCCTQKMKEAYARAGFSNFVRSAFGVSKVPIAE